MQEWSFNKNRMLSVIETNENPKITYYICCCFKRRKYQNENLNSNNTLTEDLLYVENPIKDNKE